MKVGVAVFSHTASGMEVGTIDVALGLHAAGVDVTVFAEHDARLPDRATPIASSVVRLKPLPVVLTRPRPADAMFLLTKMMLARRLAEAVEKRPTDVLHVTSPGCAAHVPRGIAVAVQAWMHPPTLAARFRTYLPHAPRFPPVYLANVLREIQSHISDHRGYRRADVVLCNTPRAADAMRDAGYPAEYVPPPIEMAEVGQREPGDRLRLAFCGHPLHRPRKGLADLLSALTRVATPVRLTLFGGGASELQRAIDAARAAGHEIELPGRVPREAYLDHLAYRTDALVFTSRFEEWGYALFEALSRGVPAIAYGSHPYGEVIDADMGVVVPPGDIDALAAAIGEAAAGRLPRGHDVYDATARHFGSHAVARRLIDVYGALASAAPSPTAGEGHLLVYGTRR